MFNIKQLIFTKDIAFSDIANSWLMSNYNSVKESTYFDYKYVIKKYFNPELKDKSIKQLLKYDFNILINNLNNLDKTSIKKIVTILKSILKYAERKYDVDFKLDLIKVIDKETKEIKIFTTREKKKLVNHCYNSEILKEVGILVSLYTGLRIGELCALKWKDIDLNKDILTVNHTLQRVSTDKGTKILFGPPKTRSSLRQIPINKTLHNILYRIYVLNNYNKNSFFLTGSTTEFIEPRNYQYTFKVLLENLKIPYHNFHILRHTFATDCININMDVKTLSRILGHSNVNITLNKYVHPSFKKAKVYLERI